MLLGHLEAVAEIPLGGSMSGDSIPQLRQLGLEALYSVVIERFRRSRRGRRGALDLEVSELLLCGFDLGAEGGDLGVGAGQGVANVVGAGFEK
jgi:hypothetical protein